MPLKRFKRVSYNQDRIYKEPLNPAKMQNSLVKSMLDYEPPEVKGTILLEVAKGDFIKTTVDTQLKELIEDKPGLYNKLINRTKPNLRLEPETNQIYYVEVNRKQPPVQHHHDLNVQLD